MYHVDFQKPCHAHFIGIGGTSMSGLARLLHEEGFTVTGSDTVPSKYCDNLRKQGIPVYPEHSEENMKNNPDIAFVVYTAAIFMDNPEYTYALAHDIPVLSRAQFLGQLMDSLLAQTHKDFHITVRDDYDEKQLITKLTAREGPVLIDSSILGFEQYKNLWMPLGNLFVQLGIEKELIPNAMKLGEIDGELYGVISNFWIETVITKSVNARHWDYDEFMKLVREKPIKAISNYQNGDKGMLLFTSLLNHGLEDNYFLNKELGGKSFASKEFYALLELAEKYYGEGALGQQDAVLWPEGDTLCHLIDISKPEDLELYKAVYGEELYFAGYPSRQGQGHYLNAMEPLTIRNTAGTKEKAIALTFMKYLLSEEVQKEAGRDHNFFLSVRRGVLGKQVQGVERGMEVTKYGYAPFKIMDDPDTETDEKMLFELIDSSSPRKYFPKELRDIIYGELNEYFEGMITKDALSDHLENRVSLYLNEEN